MNTLTRSGLIRHNHDLGPMNSFKSIECERCLQNARTTGFEVHTCSHKGAFGKRDDACKRCVQLKKGINASTVLGESLKKAKRDEAMRELAIKNHNCVKSRCNVVCTAFEW